MIHPKRMVALALIASLACSATGLSAQESGAKKKRRPPSVETEEVTKEEYYRARQKRRGARVNVHVKKMLALAVELREGGFEEEAEALIRQAKRLASKKSRYGDTRGEGEKRRIAWPRRPAPVAAPEPVVDVIEVEPPIARDVTRTRELERARARARAGYEKARRMKADLARRDPRREYDLDRRVESLTKQVKELRHMIEDLKHTLHKGHMHKGHKGHKGHEEPEPPRERRRMDRVPRAR